MQIACDILPPTEVQNGKTGVTCPLYVICYTNVDIPIAMSGNALAYDFNLLSLQRTFLCTSWRHWFRKANGTHFVTDKLSSRYDKTKCN